MTIIFETFGGIILFLAIGFFFLWIFASLISGVRTESPYQRLESIFSTRQINRRDDKLEILEHIGAPECPDGTYSPRQNTLWRQYNELDRIDKELIRQERYQLVNARGYLPDEIADIIEGKR